MTILGEYIGAIMLFIMIFVFGIAFLLGWVSSYYNKLFMSIIFGLPVAGGAALKLSAPLLSSANMTLGEVFAALPSSIQTLIMVAPILIIVGRISGWIYQVYFQKEKVEDRAKKRSRILALHGMDDPLAGPAPKVDWLASMNGQAASTPAPDQRRQASSVRSSKRSTSFGNRT